jgi:hypothetical protein
MKIVHFFTKRNAFSREYGTWFIVLFNFMLVPIVLQELTYPLIVFGLSIIFFLMFRFELLDVISIELQYSRKTKITKGIVYLLFSIILFSFLVLKSLIEFKIAFFICISGIIMLFLNIITRRKKGKRQNVFAQIVLVSFIVFLGSLNYYFLTGLFDRIFLTIFSTSILFYSNSIIYVRSKTLGSPFDIYALLFSAFSIIIILLLIVVADFKLGTVFILIPTFVKTLDNVILTNIKVPMRRIGINETIHCIIFILLVCVFCK